MWILYQIAVSLLSLAAAPFLLLSRGRHYQRSLKPRLGLYPAATPSSRSGTLWIHAVSVGEVAVAAALLGKCPELTEDESLLVTTVTPTGQALAGTSFPQAERTYLPFELGFAVQRFFARYNPRALVLAEGDLWPLVLRRCRKLGLPVVVVNGRVSDRSFRRMVRLRRLLGPVLSPVDHFGVQTRSDRDRLAKLGVESSRITVTGNLKFESSEPPGLGDLEDELRRLAGNRPILVAGSTMRGEEELVLDGFAEVLSQVEALLILAPRHPERWDSTAELVRRRGLRLVRRSQISASPTSATDPLPHVTLLDSMGELASVYRLANSAFIGGTLVPTGGHNPLEAARFGVPVLVGPSMENFREIAQAFDDARAWLKVEDAPELARGWQRVLREPTTGSEIGRRGLDLLARHHGAAERTSEILLRYLAREATE